MVDRPKAYARRAAELTETFQAEAPHLRRWLLSRLPNEQDARDAVQEVFLRLSQLDNAKFVEDPVKYLFGIARHVVHDIFERRRRELVEFDSDLVDHHAEHPTGHFTDGVRDTVEVQQALIRAIEGLRPIEREIVLL